MWWEYLRDYFPLRLEKTVDLDPNNTYIFCVFPHGVLSVGAFTSFATDANNFRSLFPGLRPYLVTLAGHFITPFIRELSLALGKHAGGKNNFRSTGFIMRVPQNCEKRLLGSSCPSVRLFVRIELGSHWTDFHEIYYLRIFRKSVEKIQVRSNRTRIKGTLHEDKYTFFIIHPPFLLRIMKTHFVFSIFPPPRKS